MTKVIIISGGNLDSYFEQVQQYLHAKYHTYPSSILPLEIGADESLRQKAYDAWGKSEAIVMNRPDGVKARDLVADLEKTFGISLDYGISSPERIRDFGRAYARSIGITNGITFPPGYDRLHDHVYDDNVGGVSFPPIVFPLIVFGIPACVLISILSGDIEAQVTDFMRSELPKFRPLLGLVGGFITGILSEIILAWRNPAYVRGAGCAIGLITATVLLLWFM